MQTSTNTDNFLLCPPDYFTVSYSINPWMDPKKPVDIEVAKKEWLILLETYKQLGCKINLIDPQPGLPDMVFTANAGWIILDKMVIVSKFKNTERKGEEKYFKRWFEKRGYTVKQLDVSFEGVAEAFFYKDKIFSGYGFRASEKVPQILGDFLNREVVSLRLCDPAFYHLDMCLAIPREELLVFFPGAFDQDSLKKIIDQDAEKIIVTKEDAENFGCNFIVVGNTIVMNKGTKKLAGDLYEKGFKVLELDMSEFKKAGGGVRCLTFRI